MKRLCIVTRPLRLEVVRLGGHNLDNLRYADPTALIAESAEALKYILNVAAEKNRDEGLEINI